MSRFLRGLLVSLTLLAALPATAFAQDAPLASWKAGPAREAIIDFVTRATTPGGPQFVAPADRLAVFDDNGTLWAEKPLPAEAVFSLERVKALALVHPEWQTQEPFASILRGDIDGALAGGDAALARVMAATHSGMTTAAFADQLRAWLRQAQDPGTGRRFLDQSYQPMQELLAFLRANGFRIYISSGGSTQFSRAVGTDLFGVRPEEVIGSAGAMQFQFDDGDPVILRLPEVAFINDGPGKPVGIETHIGRRPILAFGNSDGDMQLMQYVCVEPGPTFCGLLHHTDAAREWAYDRTSPVGRLDKALDAAAANGWTVIDMARDWSVVFRPAP